MRTVKWFLVWPFNISNSIYKLFPYCYILIVWLQLMMLIICLHTVYIVSIIPINTNISVYY